MNAFRFVDKISTKRRKYSYSFDSQICSSLKEQRIGHHTYEFRLISLFSTGQCHKDNHSVIQEASTVILFDSDSDNSIVYEDISPLFYNVVTLLAGAAIISRQIRTRTLFYVMICHLHGISRYEKISCNFISCIVIFKKFSLYEWIWNWMQD